MITGLGIFGESANDIFEDIAHLHAVNGFWIEVNLRELLHNAVQTVIFVHLFNLLLEFQISKNRLYIGRESFNVADKVLSNIIAVVQQPS